MQKLYSMVGKFRDSHTSPATEIVYFPVSILVTQSTVYTYMNG